eukprot:m.448455 g.448455  ORF g.448455 m.448455 type:complete len:882 (+) comp19663_c0_seq1:96-2741(+)
MPLSSRTVLAAAAALLSTLPSTTAQLSQCFVLNIGAQLDPAANGIKTVPIPGDRGNVVCPTTASRNNWVKDIAGQHATVGDRFTISVFRDASGQQMAEVRRSDAPGNIWGMNVAVTCCNAPCFQLVIGTGTNGVATATLPADQAGATCPAAVSRNNWDTSVMISGHRTVGDRFALSVSGTTVTARRVDAPGNSWGLNLAVTCCANACFTLGVGTGTAGVKSVPLPNGRLGATCPAVVNQTNWVGATTGSDTFAVRPTYTQNAVSVVRTDRPGASWGISLGVQCCNPPDPCFRVQVGRGVAAGSFGVGATAVVPASVGRFTCPATVTRDNALPTYTFGDTFATRVYGRTVSVMRTDAASLWGLNLGFMCCRIPDCFQVDAGVGSGGRKVVSIPVSRSGAVCPAVVNSSNWIASAVPGGTFAVTPTGTAGAAVGVVRTDVRGAGWNSLSFPCCDPPASQPMPCVDVNVGPGSSPVRVALPADRAQTVTCPAVINQTNWLNTATYGDTFSSTLEQNGTVLSVTRTDATTPWGMGLSVRCCGPIPDPLVPPPCFLLHVGTGPGTKTVQLPATRLGTSCPAVVNRDNWDRASDLAHATVGDVFSVTLLPGGAAVQVVRTDATAAWGMNLSFTCCGGNSLAPTAVPTTAPTARPTLFPTEHPCITGNNGCDPTSTTCSNDLTNGEPVIGAGTSSAHVCACRFNRGWTVRLTATTCGTVAPTTSPTATPTATPTRSPSATPTTSPTDYPTEFPTAFPTNAPSTSPTAAPSPVPTTSPTASPTNPAAASSSGGGDGAGGSLLIIIIVAVVVIVVVVAVALGIAIGRGVFSKGDANGAPPTQEKAVSFENPLYDGATENPMYDEDGGYSDVQAAEGGDSSYMDIAGPEEN